jgi:DNA-binding transcriptional ArsR family regulator
MLDLESGFCYHAAMDKDEFFYRHYSHICKIIVHPVRQQIIDFLAAGEQSVTTIQTHLGIPMSNTSNHLNALFQVGVVRRRKEGAFIFYSLSEPALVPALANMKRLIVSMATQSSRDLAEYEAVVAAADAAETRSHKKGGHA